jgi:hypothetical protein
LCETNETMTAKFECVARGTESVDKAFPLLDETRVQFMYIKFPVGSGTFKRSKFVYVHFVGPKCGIVKRGKWNAEVGNMLALFNAPSGLEVDDKNVLSFAYLVSQLKKVFVADDGSFSLQKIQEEYNRRIAEEAAKHSGGSAGGAAGVASDEPLSPVRQRKLAVELGLNTESVLKALREDLGPFNWATFEPNPTKLTLAEGGSGGIFELADQLPDDKVVFGLLRLAFGTGRFRRTKRVFFQWSGDNVGAVAKGKANMLFAGMSQALAPHNAEIRLVGKGDLSPQAILDRIKSIFTVDNIELPSADGKLKKATFSAEEYIQSLLEEQNKVRDFYQEPDVAATPAGPTAPSTFDVAETIAGIQKDEGGYSWGIFQVK